MARQRSRVNPSFWRRPADPGGPVYLDIVIHRLGQQKKLVTLETGDLSHPPF
jgi:hypothetical protein